VDPRPVKVLGCRWEQVSDGQSVVVVSVRARVGEHDRCPRCRVRCAVYDAGRVRRWRALDWGRQRVFVEARPPRVRCAEHGVVTAAVPWARHRSRHTYGFERVAAWSATQMSATAATVLLRCSWRTIGTMVARVAADLRAESAAAGDDGLSGLRRIGIDEVSYRRGHTYLTVVVDHDSRRLVWAAPGRDRATVDSFFAALGSARCGQLTHITSDSAAWIARPVAAHAPAAVHCADPFHVVRWAGEAVNLVRRQVWNAVRRTPAQGGGRDRPAVGEGKTVNRATWALRKNPEHWTENQTAAMTWIAVNHPRLHRAWRLKEALRAVFATGRDSRHGGRPAITLLDRWLAWARRSRLPEFVDVARKITRHRAAIDANLLTGLSNGLTESVNTKIRLITRRGYGFRNVHALIALTQLSLGLHKPALPT
jgi:transposase